LPFVQDYRGDCLTLVGALAVLPAADAAQCRVPLQRQGASNDMVERAAVLLGTVQFRLKVKVNIPDSATLADAEKAALSTLADDPVRKWTLVDELGVGHPVQLALDDFLEVSLQSVETCVPTDEQPEVLWERED
jgi:hypothetical protein